MDLFAVLGCKLTQLASIQFGGLAGLTTKDPQAVYFWQQKSVPLIQQGV